MKKSIKQMQSSSLGQLSVRFLSKQKLLILLAVIMTAINTYALDFEVGGIHYSVLNDKTSEVEVVKKSSPYSGSVDIPVSVEYQGIRFAVTSIGQRAFSDCQDLTSVTIGNSVTSISHSAFSNSYNLTSVTIPNSVTSIGDNAFYECFRLTSVTIPNSVTSIGTAAFKNSGIYNDPSNWEDGVLYIDNHLIIANRDILRGNYAIKEGTLTLANSAFQLCSNLISVTIPNSVTTIGSYAFNDCLILQSVIIGNSVTTIGERAFEDCILLTTMTIPNSVTSIGKFAFEDCKRLTAVNIPDSVTLIGRGVFLGTALYKDPSNWEDGVLYIGNHLFEANKGLLPRNYTIKNGTLTIAEGAFDGCIILNSVTIPNSVTSIGAWTFSNCTGLTSVTIPNSVTLIGREAFGSGLNEVIMSWENPEGKEVDKDAFLYNNEIILYVPMGTTENYIYRTPWCNFKEIKEYMPGGYEGEERCKAPAISLYNGKLVFTSSTPSAKYIYTIVCEDAQALTDSDNGVVDLIGTYKISVCAYAEGFDNSDIVTATLVWVNPQIEGAGVMSMEAKKAVLIKSIGDAIVICGTEYGENIQIYSIDGMLLDTTKAVDGETILPLKLQKGEIVIIRYGDKSIKYKF